MHRFADCPCGDAHQLTPPCPPYIYPRQQVCGGPITVSQEVKGINDFSDKGFAAKVSAKWSHACGFAIDKFDNSSKATVLETSFSKFSVPGLKAAVNMNQTYGAKASTTFPMEVSYSNDLLATSLSTQYPDFNAIKANVTLQADSLTVGTSVTYKGGAVTDYPLSLMYAGGDYAAAVEATEKLKTFTLLGSYNVNKQLTLAGKFGIPDGGNMSFVGKYKLNDEIGTVASAKFSAASKNLEVAVKATPVAKVDTGAALSFPIDNVGGYTYGFNFTLG